MTTTALSPTDFAEALEEHHYESADDYRRVVVGLQEESNAAGIYERYAHLYTQEQLDSLGAARDAATDADEREQLNRLWFEAAGSLAEGALVQLAQDLMNEQLAWRTEWDGEQVSYNTLGALMASEPDYERRDRIYQLVCDADEHFAAREIDLAVQAQQRRAEIFGMANEIEIASARMGLDVREFAAAIQGVSERTAASYDERCTTMFPELLGAESDEHPSRGHAAYLRSLHVHDDVYTRERMVEVCEKTVAELGFPLGEIPTILPDLEDRPQKSPRACVVPARVPREVHLVVRPTGGITDYQAFLHEAGHALHFGLANESLPFAYRSLSPDHALTEIYSYVVERITHAPAWHMRHFGLSREQAEAVCANIRFVDASLFRRYSAKLTYELEFWTDPASPRNADRYAMLLSQATNMRYPTSQFASDIDAGLYAADYLRAWRTSEQVIAWLEREHGEEWFCQPATGTFLRELFVQGTRPTNEEISRQIGSSPDDYGDLERVISG